MRLHSRRTAPRRHTGVRRAERAAVSHGVAGLSIRALVPAGLGGGCAGVARGAPAHPRRSRGWWGLGASPMNGAEEDHVVGGAENASGKVHDDVGDLDEVGRRVANGPWLRWGGTS